jgi:hypothetical protein
LQVAQGVPLDKIVESTIKSQLTGGASSIVNNEVLSALSGVVDDPFLQTVVNNAATVVTNAAITGNTDNIGTTILGSVVGTTVTAQTGDAALGTAAATLTTTGGNVAAAANAYAAATGTSAATANKAVTALQNSDVVTAGTTGATNLTNTLAAADTTGTGALSTAGTSNLATKNITSSITDGGGALSTITGTPNILTDVGNYTDEFGNYDAAVAANAAKVTKPTSFNDTFAANRLAFGPNTTFEWTNPATGVTGTFTTGTGEEATAAANAKINALNTANLSTVTDASQTVAAQNDATARALAAKNTAALTSANNVLNSSNTDYWSGSAGTDTLGSTIGALQTPNLTVQQSNAETQRLANQNAALANANTTESSAESKRLFEQNNALGLAKAAQAATAAKAAINSIFGEGSTAAAIAQQGLANINQATGQTIEFVGATGSALGLTGPVNALTNAGQSVTRAGEALQLESVNEANQNVIQAVNDAQGLGNKIVAGVKAVYNNPQSLNMAAIEVIQEGLPIGLGLKVLKYAGKFAAVGVDVALNAMESGGAAYNDKYREAKAANMTDAQADAVATTAFEIAAAVTVATGGVADAALVNKVSNALSKATTKAGASFTKEGTSDLIEAFTTDVLTDVALGRPVNINKSLTQGVIEGLVAGKTSSSIEVSNIQKVIADTNTTLN